MKLRKGQILYIDNQKYIVINMIEYREDTWIWQEYEIIGENNNSHKWLSIEENESHPIEYYLYDIYRGSVDINEIEIFIDNKKYELYEKGRAIVVDYFGNADVDKYESCFYYDYISQDKTNIISVEKWDGETEKSIGMYIPPEKIKITEEVKYTPPVRERKKGGNMIIATISVLIIAIPLLLSFISDNMNKSIEKYLSKEKAKYIYVTSVTNNTNNKKAKVYESTFLNIDLTVKDIIDGVPEGITKTIDSDPSTQEDGIGLQTNGEYAYVYEEKGKIYVQVSSKKYLNNSGTMYHSHHHRHYYNTYSSNRSSSTYSNYAYSARQNSINSRVSSGGGTSSGK